MRIALTLGALSAVALGVGCQNNSSVPISNPFLGPDRVPPPATRGPTPGTAQPYYGAAPGSAPQVTPGFSQPPQTFGTPVPAGPPTTIPGAAPLPQSGFQQPQGLGTPGLTPGFGATASQQPGVVQATALQSVAAGPNVSVPADPHSLRFNGAAEQPITPTPLQPPVGPQPGVTTAPTPTPSAMDRWQQPLRSASLQPVSASAEAPPTGFQPPTPVKQPGKSTRYAASPTYDQLSGQLEFNEASGQWRIRFASAGSAGDAFGGTLVVSNPAALEGYRPGDFVTVSGALERRQLDAQSFVNVYQVASVDAQRR